MKPKMSGMEVSLINKRGRIIYVPVEKSQKLIDEEGMRFFPNPRRMYYPEYDQTVTPNVPDLEIEQLEGDILDTEAL